MSAIAVSHAMLPISVCVQPAVVLSGLHSALDNALVFITVSGNIVLDGWIVRVLLCFNSSELFTRVVAICLSSLDLKALSVSR